MWVIWLVFGSKCTHVAGRAVEPQPIGYVAGVVWQIDRVDVCRLEHESFVDAAGLVWQFDQVDGGQRTLMQAFLV